MSTGRFCRRSCAPDPFAHREPVHVRHVHVEQDDAGQRVSGKQTDGRRAGVDRLGGHAPALQQPDQDLAIHGVVVDDQGVAPIQAGKLRCRLCRELDAQVQRKEEGAAMAGFAFDPEPSAHQLHEAVGYCQAEAGTTVLARGRGVFLGEGIEDVGLLFRGDADARITDRDADRGALSVQ
jgi:hypothetical protein